MLSNSQQQISGMGGHSRCDTNTINKHCLHVYGHYVCVSFVRTS